jgi:ABC-type Na+ transport system ATPase subunit NatA
LPGAPTLAKLSRTGKNMEVPAKFTNFKIEGLRGGPDINVDISDNTLIMVGENGSGKTTFLRILFYFLSGRWSGLSQFKFTKITATINDREHVVRYKDIEAVTPRLSDISIARLVELGRLDEAEAMLAHYGARYGISNYRQRFTASGKLDKSAQALVELQERLAATLGAQILYLPTY